MLKLAYVYKDKLQLEYNNVIFNDKYKFYNFSNYWEHTVKLSENSWDNIEMVSVDRNDNVLGYFRAGIARDADKVSSLGIMNFHEKNITFSKDLYKFLEDLFTKYNFRKIEFTVVIGNPAEKMYDRVMKKYSGNIVGIKKKSTRLIDGLYYDVKMYEIFNEDYDARISI